MFDERGDEVGPGGGGYLVLKRPWPAMLRGIFGDDARYRETYWSRYENVYFAGDGARIDRDGDFWLLGRVDDVMNVSGHRISTIEVESALVDHHDVAEAAVCSRKDAITGEAIVAYVTLKSGRERLGREARGAAQPRRREDRSDREAGEHRLHARSCRRRAAARSCAGCSATWPRTASSATRRRSPTRRWWRRSSTAPPTAPATRLDSPVAVGTILGRMESLETTSLMTIGRFSRLTGLTVKALRHYDELGLLRPAAVDPATGYRSYSSAQVAVAEAIRTLRRLELPLDDISSLLATDDPAAVRRVLVDHQRRTAHRAAELNVILQGLQPLIDGKETVMGTPAEALDAEAERRLGVDLFNKTWTLMEKEDRTQDDDDEMVHCAHASAYHWRQVGTPANRSRSEWQCSRVYAILGRTEPALHHARRCLEIVDAHPDDMKDWDRPAALEALARAHWVAGDLDEARRYAAEGRELTARIEDDDDRAIIEADFATIRI